MQSKLTLRLDERLIRRAKAIAKRRGKSVSQMVADYFASMEDASAKPEDPLTPLMRSLKGALRGAKVDRADYYNYLEGKHR